MSMFSGDDDESSDDRTMFHRGEDEQEEVEDSNMFSRERKKSDTSLLEWLCNPVWTSNLEE